MKIAFEVHSCRPFAQFLVLLPIGIVSLVPTPLLLNLPDNPVFEIILVYVIRDLLNNEKQICDLLGEFFCVALR